MASSWVSKRTYASGTVRYIVKFRLRGRDSTQHYAGLFRTREEAEARLAWVRQEIAAMRYPDIKALEKPLPKDPNAVALGRKGGLKGGPARAKRLTSGERSEMARRAALVRWEKYEGSAEKIERNHAWFKTRAEIATQLREDGMMWRDIATIFGTSHNTVRRWVSDDYRVEQNAKAKRYKSSHKGVCIDCGGETQYAGKGEKKTSIRCISCALERRRFWTREKIIDALRRFAEANGRPPKSTEWIKANPGLNYPPRSAVYRARKKDTKAPFEKWNDAIRAAGFKPMREHTPIDVGLLLELIDEGASAQEMADALGASVAGVYVARKRLQV